MASQTNHNASYLYEIDGITLWERLRVIRGFIEDREVALESSIISQEEAEYNLSQLDDSKESEFKKRKHEIYKRSSEDAIQKCKNEIEFLKDLEKELSERAEETRVEGKTDEEMYELNFYNELTARIVRKAQCEIVAQGSISPSTMQEIAKCPPALHKLSEQGILEGPKVAKLLTDGEIKGIEYFD